MKAFNKTILIVEDDSNDAHLIEIAFRSVGVTGPIHNAVNGMDAIAYMLGEGKYSDRTKYAYPTFITTDLKMPLADGFAVLEHLKKHPDWAIIPTVVFSGSTDTDDIKRAYRLGASSYHEKPSSLDALRIQMKVLHDYWMTCHVPEVDISGKHLATIARGKLGERFVPSPEKLGTSA